MSQLSLFHLQIKTRRSASSPSSSIFINLLLSKYFPGFPWGQFSQFLSPYRRFNETTIQILESVLVSKDVKSLMEVRSSLTEFLRSESLCVIRTIADKTVQQKLLVLEFFVRAFAIVGDSESCLALRYEALVMRQLKSASCEWLRVSYDEWLNFAEHALDSGFHSIAGKACENALLCFQKNDLVEPETYKFSEDLGAVRKIKRLKDFAMTSISSRSVQVQAAEYLKRKRTEKSKTDSFCKENQCLASISFRNGIKKRNLQKLHEHQSILRINDELDINNMDEASL
ncbi:F10K1.23 [Quillaja saponaria]|uniref:F10K1.23 n=1 Tax=Quillaja saponaria TaxID=32244 RepID=A0AAD7LVK1_QUISA|nr:F10K1.23 [Quillaja saponaria]